MVTRVIRRSFNAKNAPPGATLLAAVGPLQFEVVQWRLQSEYNAESRLTPTPWTVLRWLKLPPDQIPGPGKTFDYSRLIVATGVVMALVMAAPSRTVTFKVSSTLAPATACGLVML